MSMKKRVFIIFCIIFLITVFAFTAIFYITARNINYRLENEIMRENMERAFYALQNEINILDKLVTDEAVWDDSYHFVIDKNRDYIENNLVESTFDNSNLNYIVFLDIEGKKVYAEGYDFIKKKDIPVPDEILLNVCNLPDGKKGIVTSSAGPVLIAAEPVMKSDGSGPSAGSLIFGRLLTDRELDKISERVRLDLALYPLDSKEFYGLETAGTLQNGNPIYVESLTTKKAVGFTAVKDLEGKDVLLLQVSYDRWMPEVLKSIAHIFGILLLTVLFLCFYLFWKWFDEKITYRLTLLTKAVEKTDLNSLSAADIPVFAEDDELTVLSAAVKQMVERIEEQQHDIVENEEKWHSLLSNAPGAIFVIQDGNVVFARGKMILEAGYSLEEVIKKPFKNFIYRRDLRNLLKVYQELLEEKRLKLIYSVRIMDKKGNIIWIEDNAAAINWEGKPATLHFVRDITARKILEEEINRLMAEKNMILDSLTERVTLIDQDMHIIWTNKKNAHPSEGGDLSNIGELWGGRCYEVWAKRNDICPGCPAVEALQTGAFSNGEVEFPDGRIWRINANPVRDRNGRITGVVTAGLDITERKQYEEKLKYLSLHDALTGLYNRAYFETELKRWAGSRDYPITVIIADLDGLKLINDTMGHNIGDEMLKAFAEVLKSVFRPSDGVFRIGGDEFAVILPATDAKAADEIIKRIYFAFNN